MRSDVAKSKKELSRCHCIGIGPQVLSCCSMVVQSLHYLVDWCSKRNAGFCQAWNVSDSDKHNAGLQSLQCIRFWQLPLQLCRGLAPRTLFEVLGLTSALSAYLLSAQLCQTLSSLSRHVPHCVGIQPIQQRWTLWTKQSNQIQL